MNYDDYGFPIFDEDYDDEFSQKLKDIPEEKPVKAAKTKKPKEEKKSENALW